MWEFILGLSIFATILTSLVGLGYLTKAVFNIHQCSSELPPDQVNAAQDKIGAYNTDITALNSTISNLNAQIQTLQATIDDDNKKTNPTVPIATINDLTNQLNNLKGQLKTNQDSLLIKQSDLEKEQKIIKTGVAIPGCNQIDLNDTTKLNLSKMGLVVVWILFAVGIIAGIIGFMG